MVATRSGRKSMGGSAISMPALKSSGEKFLAFSCFVVVSTSILATANPALYLGNFAGVAALVKEAGADFEVVAPLFTTFGLGWGAGKAACVASGPAAVKKFSQFNSIPMVGMIYISHVYEDLVGVATWGAFLAAYAYFGFVDKPKKK